LFPAHDSADILASELNPPPPTSFSLLVQQRHLRLSSDFTRDVQVRANGLIIFVPKFGIEGLVYLDAKDRKAGEPSGNAEPSQYVLDEEKQTVQSKDGKVSFKVTPPPSPPGHPFCSRSSARTSMESCLHVAVTDSLHKLWRRMLFVCRSTRRCVCCNLHGRCMSYKSIRSFAF